ncbi:glycosyltransferase family A protein [Ferrimonas gelatinilytica]
MHIRFFVFSYNRGEYLQNCIDSIRQCAPGHPITVMDDQSSDPQTRQVLERLSEHCQIWSPKGNEGQSKHGGLYNNMQAALEMADGKGLICFLQDDTQLVRAISPEEITQINAYFENQAKAGFIQPAFIRGCNRATDDAHTHYDAQTGMYFVDRKKRSVGTYYADILITRPDRLKAVDWQFEQREPANEQQAKRHFTPMAYLANPFAAWLPNVPAYRGKVKTWALRRAEVQTGAGFNPVGILSEAESDALARRDKALAPYAEDWLTPLNGEVAKPWIYYPLQGRRWLKRFNNLEVKLRKLLG